MCQKLTNFQSQGYFASVTLKTALGLEIDLKNSYKTLMQLNSSKKPLTSFTCFSSPGTFQFLSP